MEYVYFHHPILVQKNALKHIINYIESRFKNKNYKIILRPHPKEKINKLIQLTKGFKKLKISKNSIQKDLINSSYAYGSNSMGLVIADKIFRCKVFNLHIFKGFKIYYLINLLSKLNYFGKL